MVPALALAAWAAALGAVPAPLAAQSLEESLTAAYRTNPTLLAARAELRSVNEAVPQELSNWRPDVGGEARAGRQKVDRKRTKADSTTPRDAELRVDQPLYRGGRTVAGVARAEAEVRAQRARLTSEEQSVLLAAGIAYMDVWRDQAVLRLNQGNERVLARELEATTDRFDVGELTRTDVAQAEARLARAEAARISSEGDLASSQAVFEEVVGFAPGALTRPPPLTGLPANLEEAVAVAAERNLDLRTAISAEKAAGHQVRASVGELLPEVFLTAQLRHSQEQAGGNTEVNEARLLAVITVPLYQQGFVTSGVRQDKQIATQRRIEIDEARRGAIRETIDAWEELVSARAESSAFESEVRSGEIALEGVRQENTVGARTILDVLDAEQELLDAQVNLTVSRRDAVVAAFRVRRALGGLTAASLGLPVVIYDPEADYRAVRDLWYGQRIPGE